MDRPDITTSVKFEDITGPQGLLCQIQKLTSMGSQIVEIGETSYQYRIEVEMKNSKS